MCKNLTKIPRLGGLLLEAELDAFGLLCLPSFADDRLDATLALRNRLTEAEL